MIRKLTLAVLALTAATSGVTVRGKLCRYIDPDVVTASGVNVVLWRGDTLKDSTTTGQDGMYYFLRVPVGTYRLKVTPPGDSRFAPLEHRFSIRPGTETFDVAVQLLVPLGPKEAPPGTTGPRAGTPPRLAALAAAQVELDSGACDVGGDNMGPWVRKYMKGREGEEWPWAAGFVSWCYEQSKTGMPFKYTFSSAAMVGQFAQKGWFHPIGGGHVPQPGDVMFAPGGPAGFKRCGIVESSRGDTMTCIEGNSREEGRLDGYEGVYRRTRSRSSYAFGHVPDDFR